MHYIGTSALASCEVCHASETNDWHVLHQIGFRAALGIICIAGV